MRKYLLFIIAVFVIGCHDNVVRNSVTVRLEKIDTTAICVDSMFTDLKIIKLDTANGAFLKYADKIVYNEYIYVSDGDILCVFDTLGTILGKLDAKGKAKNEYLAITNLDVTDKRVFVLDASSEKILMYDKNLKFISVIPLNDPSVSFVALDDNSLILDNIYIDNEKKKKFTSIDIEKGECIDFYDMDKYKVKYMRPFSLNNFFYDGTELSFFEMHSNDVLSLLGDSVTVKYNLDFCSKQAPKSLYDKEYKDYLAFYMAYNNADYAYGIFSFAENTNNAVFGFYYEESIVSCQYDKVKGVVKNCGKLELFKGVNLYWVHSNGKIFSSLNLEDMLEASQSNQEVAEFLAKNDITESSNPVLIMMNLK